VRHEADRCNGQWSHSPFQVGDVPLERSGREVPDGERAAPKRSGEVRDRPPRRQAWQSDSMVSSNELGFDLRESSPLPHNILSRVRLAADPDVGQPVGCSLGHRGCRIAPDNPKEEACYLDYHVSTGDSAKSGLGHFDNQP
jgi:hypothetical protein